MLVNNSVMLIIKQALTQTFIAALIWVFFYQFSTWLFAYFEYNPHVSWVFLPAGIRMLAVFVFGWNGVLGLFLGSIITNDHDIDMAVFEIAFISALAPMLALYICRWSFAIPNSLAGLTGMQLLVFALSGAFANAFLSQLYFHTNDSRLLVYDFIPMFVGDLLGTIIIFYTIAKLLQRLSAKHNSD